MPKLWYQNNLNAGEDMRGTSQGLVQEHFGALEVSSENGRLFSSECYLSCHFKV